MPTNFPPMPPAVDRATALLAAIFDLAGNGIHTLSLVVASDAHQARAVVPFHNSSEHTDTEKEAVADAIAVLARTEGAVGAAVLRTYHQGGAIRVIGWNIRDCTAHPVGGAEIRAAMCTDALTGEPIPPEVGARYEDAPTVDA